MALYFPLEKAMPYPSFLSFPLIPADYGIILDGWFCPANRSRQLNMRHGTLERGTLYVPWHILSGNGMLWNLYRFP